MEAGSLLHLPLFLKRIIAFTLTLGFVSAAVLLVLTFIGGPPASPLLESAVSLFQFLATGSALAIIAFYSTKNIGTEELLALISNFLIREMPKAFRANLIVRPLQHDSWSTTDKIEDISNATIETDHVLGTISATYLVEAFESRIKMRITLNAFRFVILYYIPLLKHSEKDIEKAIELVTAGAKTVEYTYRIAKNPSLESNAQIIEVYFYRTSERDLLLDSSSRLFWSQDIAVMTKSMILQLKRNGVIMDY